MRIDASPQIHVRQTSNCRSTLATARMMSQAKRSGSIPIKAEWIEIQPVFIS
jgi:hypothetical protein